MTCPTPLPWRAILPIWPLDWREAWGRRANDLANEGHRFPEDERLAFHEMRALRRAGLPPPLPRAALTSVQEDLPLTGEKP